MAPAGSPEIRRVIQIIDERIQALQTIKQMLISEFFAEQQDLFSVSRAPAVPAPKYVPITGLKPKRTRKQEIVQYLREHGPTKSIEIHERTGIPMGTVATALNDKTTFERLDDNRWTVRVGSSI